MSKRDSHNVSDHSAGSPIGTSTFEVVDIVDPDKTGRILVRPVGDAEGFADPSECQWIPASTPGFAQLRGIGMFPPHTYEKGSLIMAHNTGQQGWVAAAAIPNTRTEEGLQDTHPEAKGEEHKHSEKSGMAKDNKNKTYEVGSVFPDHDKDQASFEWARGFRLEHMGQHFKGKLKESAEKQQMPQRFLKRMETRNGDVQNSIGNFLFGNGDMTSATKFMQGVQSPPILESTFGILDSLKQTAQSGQNIMANLSVGGLGNVMSALSAASAAVSKVQKQNENNTKDPVEEFLQALYRKTKNKEPLDANGNETKDYRDWKVQYLATGIA
jgi:hypothetical protein